MRPTRPITQTAHVSQAQRVTLITTANDQQQSPPFGAHVTALLQVVFFAPLTAAA
jgi:hypothetical protein